MNQSQSQEQRPATIVDAVNWYDTYANEYDDLFADMRNDSDRLARELVGPVLSAYNETQSISSIVDVGCGTGFDLEAMCKDLPGRLGKELRLCGLEISARMAERAQDRLRTYLPGTVTKIAWDERFDVFDAGFPAAFDLHFGKGHFDAATFLGNILCHIPPQDPADTSSPWSGYLKVFLNLKRILRPGGLIVVEFRDGDLLQKSIMGSRNSNSIKSDDTERRCTYEHRAIVQRGVEGTVVDSFFRYTEKDEQLFTINTYFVILQDQGSHSEAVTTAPGEIRALRTIDVHFVRPRLVRKAMVEAGFKLIQSSDYRSSLQYGNVLVGVRE